MKEALFIKINREKWIEIESDLDHHKQILPDKLTSHFVRLTDDLSFAKTYFPNSKTHAYLNELASRIHQLVYKNKKENKKRLITFWKKELPLIIYSSRKEMAYSFLIFSIAMLVGAFSSAHDENFARLIMGDGYINMTEANISNNDPMAVYKDARQVDMFFGITLNNIRVSFFVFAMGILASFGTAFMLMTNGIMLGAFQYFFYTKGLLLTSALTIWIHGTLEISSIVIAGAAGLVIGNSILFPRSFSRLDSFRTGAKKGMKIVIGLVPLFIMAGFLESFVTRLTEMPIALKLFIIATSLAFVLYYFIFYPKIVHTNGSLSAKD